MCHRLWHVGGEVLVKRFSLVACLWYLDDVNGVAVALQNRGHGCTAGTVGERAMHENDILDRSLGERGHADAQNAQREEYTAKIRTVIVLRDAKAVWKFSFDQVAGLNNSPITAERLGAKNNAAQAIGSKRQNYPNCAEDLPILITRTALIRSGHDNKTRNVGAPGSRDFQTFARPRRMGYNGGSPGVFRVYIRWNC